uniref:NAF domain-containing protein n=1 Tax=Nelumbo nucifera TaxID=4432 RepID=A0A822Z657_NELNU|nr:TPA_asm: hypothetical protein HUJ06_014650 [Nelumbo nucifera]
MTIPDKAREWRGICERRKCLERSRDGFEQQDEATTHGMAAAIFIATTERSFDLSLLFEEKRGKKEELRFTTTKPVSSVIARPEEVAKAKKFNVKKSESRVKL